MLIGLVPNPPLFFDAMRTHHVAIAGGHAVLWLRPSHRRRWHLGSTDLFVPTDTFPAFCSWFEQNVPSNIVDISRWECDAVLPIPGVRERRIYRAADATFNIHRSVTMSPLYPIAQSYGTHLFCFITADAICIAYPHSFLRDIFCARADTSIDLQVAKYISRGFHLRLSATKAIRTSKGRCAAHGTCPRARRFFGDSECFTVFFDDHDSHTSNVITPIHTHALTTMWVFGRPPCGSRRCCVPVPGVSADVIFAYPYSLF